MKPRENQVSKHMKAKLQKSRDENQPETWNENFLMSLDSVKSRESKSTLRHKNAITP